MKDDKSNTSFIEKRIFLVRGKQVMLDVDLSELYGVATKNLNKAVSRNIDRFPDDFMFQLNIQEVRSLKFHFGTSSWGGTRKLPRAFTEQGVAMLSSVLRSKQAVHVNIVIMRAFVHLRDMASKHRELTRRLSQLEEKVGGHEQDIQSIFEAIRKLMMPVSSKRNRKIGFRVGDKDQN